MLFVRHYYRSLLMGVLIFWLSITESASINPGRILHIAHADKIGHILAYAVFTAILLFDSCRWKRGLPFKYLLLLVPVMFGVIMELLQRILTSDRQAELYDIIADAAGIAIGLCCAITAKKLLNRLNTERR